MTMWSKTGAGSEAYHYHPSGWRIYKKPASGSGTLYMYGSGGQLLHEEPDTSSTYPKTEYLYFAGRLLYVTAKPSVSDNWVYTAVYTDRLGTVRARGIGTNLTHSSYYPFGEEVGTPSANNAYKFASTYRDSSSGLDYAVNRYYASGMGRFLTTDQGPRKTGRPQSWNHYTYALNDPVNLFDPQGLDAGTACGTDAAGLAMCDIDTAGDAEMGRIFYDSMIAATSEGEGPADWDPTPTGISAGSSSSPPPPPQYYLKVRSNCYSYRNGPNITREITYSLWTVGQGGAPDRPSTGAPNEFVWENVTSQSTGLPVDSQQPNTGTLSGVYEDQQSLGGLAPSSQERWLVQQFYLGTGTTINWFAHLSVQGWGATLLIHQTSQYVSINGSRGGTVDENGQWHPNMCGSQ